MNKSKEDKKSISRSYPENKASPLTAVEQKRLERVLEQQLFRGGK